MRKKYWLVGLLMVSLLAGCKETISDIDWGYVQVTSVSDEEASLVDRMIHALNTRDEEKFSGLFSPDRLKAPLLYEGLVSYLGEVEAYRIDSLGDQMKVRLLGKTQQVDLIYQLDQDLIVSVDLQESLPGLSQADYLLEPSQAPRVEADLITSEDLNDYRADLETRAKEVVEALQAGQYGPIKNLSKSEDFNYSGNSVDSEGAFKDMLEELQALYGARALEDLVLEEVESDGANYYVSLQSADQDLDLSLCFTPDLVLSEISSRKSDLLSICGGQGHLETSDYYADYMIKPEIKARYSHYFNHGSGPINDFIMHLKEGNTEALYGLLSSDLRNRLSLKDFEAYIRLLMKRERFDASETRDYLVVGLNYDYNDIFFYSKAYYADEAEVVHNEVTLEAKKDSRTYTYGDNKNLVENITMKRWYEDLRDYDSEAYSPKTDGFYRDICRDFIQSLMADDTEAIWAIESQWGGLDSYEEYKTYFQLQKKFFGALDGVYKYKDRSYDVYMLEGTNLVIGKYAYEYILWGQDGSLKRLVIDVDVKGYIVDYTFYRLFTVEEEWN